MIARCLPFALALSLGCSTPAQWGSEASWPFEPARDAFSPDALLDLRSLNEKVAGESGFVRANADGDFVLGNGQPFRIWAVGTDVGREKPFNPRPLGRKTEPDLAYHARFLAKRGVNMVRCHAFLSPKADQPLEAMNEGDRDWIWRNVAAMKKEGIYTTISPYFALTAKPGPAWGLDADDAHALLFFHPKLQAAYKSWLRRLFTEKNPYTGIPLAQDASVALIQIQNEDSLFFWTVNNLKGKPREMLQAEYGKWLAQRHGSLNAAVRRWEGNTLPGDQIGPGRPDFHNIWEMTQARTGGFAKRLEDQTQFWAETQRKFYAEIARFLRQDLGCKQLINASNWKTADTVRLNDLERYTYTAAEVDAVNRYFGGIHRGPNEGWSIQNGDKYTNLSALLDPGQLPTNLKQTRGRPMVITESTWVFPNAYASEGPLLIAAYQGLSGVDGYYWFATGDDGFTPPQSANGYNPGQQKWLFGNPDMLGNFPAAALLHRMGYVRRGTPVLEEKRGLEDLWQRRTPLLAEEASFDPNRDAGDVAPSSSVKSALSPLSFLVGPATVDFGVPASGTKTTSLEGLLDPAKRRVVSNTRELTLDWGEGWFTMDTPSAQAVAAHLAGRRTFALKTVTFTSQNRYGSAIAVAMDGKPLATSGKVLVQVGTLCRPTGWKDEPTQIARENQPGIAGFEVKDYGKAPWQVVEAKVDVEVKNPALRKATALDANGMAAGEVPLSRTEGGVRFRFPARALYVVLQ